MTDQPSFPWDRSFDEVLLPTEPFQRTMLSKLTGLDRTDADQVLFIDCDCLVFKRLDPIFDYCDGKGLCVQGVNVQEGEWYGNVKDHLARHGVSSMPKFNGGLIYYERTANCKEMIKAVYREGNLPGESGFLYDSPLIPEEPYVSIAIAKAGLDREGNAHLIPQNMDFTNSATGLIGKLELDVMRNRCSFVCNQFTVRQVQPTVFHASRYINYTGYWKQLDRLEWLERYESSYGLGYMSPWQRLQRSVQRRYLKYIKRVL